MKWTAEQINRVRAMAAQGKSFGEVGEYFGVERCAISGLAYRHGIRFGMSQGRCVKTAAEMAIRNERIREYNRLHPEATAHSIALALGGIDSKYVARFCEREGIALRRGGSGRPKSNVVKRPKRKYVRRAEKFTGSSTLAKPTKPKLTVITNERMMIDDWIARNGVRRFERGVSGDLMGVRFFLGERGHTLSAVPGGRLRKGSANPYMLNGKRVSWDAVVAFVDRLRSTEGLEPLRVAG